MSNANLPLTRKMETGKVGVRYEPRAGNSQTNSEFRMLAHQRLDQFLDDMESRCEYGTVGVEVTFEHGMIRQVRRKSDGTDRPAT